MTGSAGQRHGVSQADAYPYVAELAIVDEVDLVELSTGHWPQLTKPDEHATLVVRIIDATGG